MLRTLLTSLLIYSITLTVAAQQSDSVTSRPISPLTPAKITSGWPVADASLPHAIVVISSAHPGVRRKCQVHEVTADTLICEASHHRPSITYRRKEVTALIAPPSHTERNIMLVAVALMVMSLVGSFLVPLAFAITLRIFTGLFFSAFGAMGVGASGTDHGEVILYQRSNPSLSQ